MRIAIAGASGFVGSALIQALRSRHQVVALTRTGRDAAPELAAGMPGVLWRSCDLFSARQTEQALGGS